MKTILFFCCLAMAAFPTTTHAQEFITTFYFEDALGNMDSVNIGYDANASYALDQQFNEVDISSQPLDADFEVRAAAYNYDLTNGCDYWEESVWEFESKTFITYYDCETATGLFQETNAIALIIKANHLPVTVSWDNDLFTENCRDNSLLANWMPGGWFDACCCFGSVAVEGLKQQSTYVFDNTDAQTIQGNDTLFTLFISLDGEIILSNPSIESKHSIAIYPNPTTDLINIEGFDPSGSSIQVFDFSGKRISVENNKTINTSNWANGIYYLKVLRGTKILTTQKIVKPGS